MENENGTTKELESIAIILFEGLADDLPKRVRDVRVGDGENKFTVTFPIPETDEQAKDFYNCSLADLVAAGCRQKTYHADNNIRAIIDKKKAEGEDPNDYAEQICAELEKALTTEKATKISEAKKIKDAKIELGMSVDEMIAFVKKAQAEDV